MAEMFSIGAEFNDLGCQNREFYEFFGQFRAATQSLYHSRGGATELLLCYPDREFGICILT